MKSFIVCFRFILALAFSSYAYEEWSVPNLTAPTVIGPRAIEVSIQHQFWGRMDGKDNVSRLYGIGDGADACFGARAIIFPRTQVFAFYDNTQLFGVSHAEFSGGASYALFVPKLRLRMQAEGEVFSYASTAVFPETRKTAVFLQGCLQNDPLWNRLSLLCNVGYNFDGNKPGLGIGLDVSVTESFGFYGEYFPVVAKPDSGLFPGDVRNPFSLGVKITTYGHQFFFSVGNSMEIGSRHLMRGAADNYLRLGFMIKRLIHFS
jgi:hypothetical protein